MNNIDPNKEIVYRRSKTVLVGLLFLAVFNCGVFPIGYLTGDNTSTQGVIFAWTILGIGAILVLWLIYDLATDKPLLTISARGLNSPKTGFLPWTDIQKFILVEDEPGYRTSRAQYMDIYPKKPTGQTQSIRMPLVFFPVTAGELFDNLLAYYKAHTSIELPREIQTIEPLTRKVVGDEILPDRPDWIKKLSNVNPIIAGFLVFLGIMLLIFIMLVISQAISGPFNYFVKYLTSLLNNLFFSK